MNKDLQILNTGSLLFPVKLKRKKVSEVKANETKEVEVSEVKKPEIESRFARLKKNLRRRSHSIL